MVDGGQATSIDNPILSSPYAPPSRHYEVGQNGPTGVTKDGRRPSESWIPIAVARKGHKGEPTQETIDRRATPIGVPREGRGCARRQPGADMPL